MPTIPLSEKNHRYTVIMAGGVGTRLWPLSRIRKPKQFQSFLSDKTLIQETFTRAQTTVPAEHICVSTGQRYAGLVREQLPLISSGQLIIEPLAKNTAPAIIYIAAILAHRDPDALVATL
ncbi:MAG: mannose-1-phosphate guanylyltransferase, partial [Candidatus Moranbacteria bacterium]|nr:mannose-1-phosphate guanylyltransferase [Candidatus Moranbacteria bacterium]